MTRSVNIFDGTPLHASATEYLHGTPVLDEKLRNRRVHLLKLP